MRSECNVKEVLRDLIIDNDLKGIKFLLEEKIFYFDLSTQYKLLAYAIIYNVDLSIIEYLINYGFDLRARCGKSNKTLPDILLYAKKENSFLYKVKNLLLNNIEI